MTLSALSGTLTRVIINPLIALLFTIGLLVFMWGVVEFLLSLNELTKTDKATGKRHMLYGILGMFIMVAAYAIVQLIGNTVCPGGLRNCYSGASTNSSSFSSPSSAPSAYPEGYPPINGAP